MIGKAIDIATPDGTMDGYAAHPDGAGPFPLVILFMDIWGLREELFAIARRIAGHGYYCLVPNLFYREGKIRYERRNADGKMVSFLTLPAALQDQMRAHVERVSRQSVRSDVAAMLDFCRGQPVKPGAAGAVGFCLGGRVSILTGQEFPDKFRATASLHGTRLANDSPDSPHRFVPRMRGEVYCGYGALDPYAAPDVREALAQAFAGNADVAYRSHLHVGADHGYALPDRDVYDGAAVEADWREVFAMFERQLARSA